MPPSDPHPQTGDPMADAVVDAVERFRRRAATAMGLARGLRTLAWGGFGLGLVVLVARVVWTPDLAELAAWRTTAWGLGALGLVAAAIHGAVHGWRRRPSATAVAALLDRRASLGGMLMARLEVADAMDPWTHRVTAPAVPRVRWPARTALGHVLAAFAFVVAAFLVPTHGSDLDADRRLEIDAPLAEVAEDVELLDEQGLLGEEGRQALEDEIARLAEEARGADPAAAWDALDQLREDVARAAAEAEEEALAAQTAVAAAEAVAEAIPKVAASDPTLARGAAGDLARLAAGIAGSEALDPELAKRLAELAAAAGGDGGLGEGRMSSLTGALSDARSALGQRLGHMRLNGLIEAELGPDRKLDPLGDEALLAFLEREDLRQASGACQSAGTLAIAAGAEPGRGGVTRGPGHVELTWTDPSSREGTSFREEVLPPSARLDRSQLLAADRVDPDGLEAGAASSGFALSGADAGGGAAQTQVVLPRHRGAVRRYFDRNAAATNASAGDPDGR